VSLGTSVAFFKIGTDYFASVTWFKCVDVYVSSCSTESKMVTPGFYNTSDAHP